MILKLGYVLTYNGKLNCALNYVYMHVGGLTMLIIAPLTLHYLLWDEYFSYSVQPCKVDLIIF